MTNYYVENKTTGIILGVYGGRDEEEAIAAMLTDAGHDGPADDDIRAYDADLTCEVCGCEGVYSPDPDGVGVTLCHDERGRVVCDDCYEAE